TAARLPVPTFGKTGTTSDYRDAWFFGFAQDLVVGVWVGNDDNRPMAGVSGGGIPARIWRSFMTQALGDGARAPVAEIPLQQADRVPTNEVQPSQAEPTPDQPAAEPAEPRPLDDDSGEKPDDGAPPGPPTGAPPPEDALPPRPDPQPESGRL
ncbi:MAG TPA: penicillin-binding protein, partial [Allosphingosinicella sp.]